ncbi:hypothetical protein SRHO_G00078900 [Serrasalmus rhombeus]
MSARPFKSFNAVFCSRLGQLLKVRGLIYSEQICLECLSSQGSAQFSMQQDSGHVFVEACSSTKAHLRTHEWSFLWVGVEESAAWDNAHLDAFSILLYTALHGLSARPIWFLAYDQVCSHRRRQTDCYYHESVSLGWIGDMAWIFERICVCAPGRILVSGGIRGKAVLALACPLPSISVAAMTQAIVDGAGRRA